MSDIAYDDFRGNFMTDFQFKALMSMVLDIMDKSKDLNEAKGSVRKLLTGNFDNTKAENQNKTARGKNPKE